MSRRLLVVAAIVVFLVSPWFNRVASAQDTLLDQAEASMLFVTSNVTAGDAPVADGPQISYNILHGRPEARAAQTLLPLYASTAVLQLLDMHSTMTAMKHGAVEGNPLMAGVTSQKPALLVVEG